MKFDSQKQAVRFLLESLTLLLDRISFILRAHLCPPPGSLMLILTDKPLKWSEERKPHDGLGTWNYLKSHFAGGRTSSAGFHHPGSKLKCCKTVLSWGGLFRVLFYLMAYIHEMRSDSGKIFFPSETVDVPMLVNHVKWSEVFRVFWLVVWLISFGGNYSRAIPTCIVLYTVHMHVLYTGISTHNRTHMLVLQVIKDMKHSCHEAYCSHYNIVQQHL